ncbi:MAG TPA: hypothetical protein VGE10_07030 [Zeimonas sp.]
MNFPATMRRQTRMCAALVLAPLLAFSACQPAYNWREIHETDAGYRILLPAKPVSMTRPIDLDGVKVTMAMTGARVDEALFTVGSVVLPAAEDEMRTHATTAMRTAMERNVQGHETKATQVEVPVLDAAGRPVGSASGVHVEVEGRVAGEPSHMSATFVARGNRAWQAVMIAPVSDPEAAKLFHESFRIAQ